MFTGLDLFMLLALALCAAKPPMPSMIPDQVVPYRTPDGWTASLRRYVGDGPPVMLVHGMGANHYNWDFAPEISLAHALQDAGWDVWVVVMPGDEGTDPPSLLDQDVDFETLADVHLPAAIRAVLHYSEADELYWVGHSMGGMLLYASLDDQPIAAGVTVSSAAQFEVPTGLVRMARRFEASEVDSAIPAQRYAWTVPFNPVVGLVSRRRHMDTALTKGLATHAIDTSPFALRQQMTRFTREGVFHRDNGSPLMDFDSHTPVLAISGSRDKLISIEDAEITCTRLPRCEFQVLEGYGHVDPVLGSTARDVVYPRIVEWLGTQR